MEAVAAKLAAGALATLGLLWDSLYGLIFGFLISAIAQVAFSRAALVRHLGPNLRGVLNATGLGIVASACSYGAAAAARGFLQKGADLRAVFAFMISSTNMNIAILIMFYAMLGWKFAFAEFAGGALIIAFVVVGVTLLLKRDEIGALAAVMPRRASSRVTECLQCGMSGHAEHAVAYENVTYLFCGTRHEREFRENPARVLAAAEGDPAGAGHAGAGHAGADHAGADHAGADHAGADHAGADHSGADSTEATVSGSFAALRRPGAWRDVLGVALGDVAMLRNELVIGFVVAGFAAALVPGEWLSGALRAVGSVPWFGYPLLLLAGLAIAVVTFVCSMGNVPIARYLAGAGIPLGANTTFIYGDLLVPPLIAIYRKTLPAKTVWTFVGLFVVGACLAGAAMDFLIGHAFGGFAAPGMAMDFSDRFTTIANALGIVALVAVVVAARLGPSAKQSALPVESNLG